MHHANSNPTNCGVNIEVIYFCFDFKVSLMSRICVKHDLISVLVYALTVPICLKPFYVWFFLSMLSF